MKVLFVTCSFALLLFSRAALADDSSFIAAYHSLTSQEIEAKPAVAPPDADKLARIDVSAPVRSASFGHKTTLLVAGTDFYVEYGPSTNRPKRLYGPFSGTGASRTKSGNE